MDSSKTGGEVTIKLSFDEADWAVIEKFAKATKQTEERVVYEMFPDIRAHILSCIQAIRDEMTRRAHLI